MKNQETQSVTMMKNVVFFTMICWLLFSCQNNKESETAGMCSTVNVTYSNSISAIISGNSCLTCHTGGAPMGGGINLASYDNVKAKATEQRGGISVLYGAVSHQTNFSAMPQGLPKISDCDIAKIKAWTDAGAPQ